MRCLSATKIQLYILERRGKIREGEWCGVLSRL